MSDGSVWPVDADWRAGVVARTLADRHAAERDTVRHVVDAAIEIVHEAGPDFTVQDVSRRAGVSRRKFYELFPSKDDLYVAMITEINVKAVATRRRLVDRVDGNAADRLRRCLLHAFDPVWGDDPTWRGIARLEARVLGNRMDELVESARPWIDYLIELVTAARADGHVTTAVDDRRIATWLERAINARLLRDQVAEGRGIPTDEPAPEELVELLLNGAFGPPGERQSGSPS